MHIKWINPPSVFLIFDRGAPALGSLYLAAECRSAGYEVSYLDMSGNEIFAACFGLEPSKFLHQLGRMPITTLGDADIYALTATSAQYESCLNILHFLRWRDPNKKVIIGGSHVSALPQEAINDGFDAVFTGEADHDLLKFLGEWSLINNNSYRVDCIAPTNLDNLPFPARDLVDLPSYCANLTVGEGLTTTIHMSRGCPFSCNYCVRSLGNAARIVRVRSPRNILDEIRQLDDSYKIQRYVATDDIWGVRKYWVKEFCELFSNENYQFRVNCRANTLHFDQLKNMKKSGIDVVSFGFESGSEQVLESISKNNVELNTKSVKACHDAGIAVKAYMIFGFSTDNEQSIEDSKKWIEEASPDSVQWSWLVPLPGTPIYTEAIKQGWKPNYSELYHLGKGARGSMNRLPWHKDETDSLYEALVKWTELRYNVVQPSIDCPVALSSD